MESKTALSKGLVQVYTGDGKGKTTAALGQAMRAAGQGLKPIVIQFIKGKPDCGEHFFVAKHPAFEIVQLYHGDAFEKSKEVLTTESKLTLVYAGKAVTEGKYDVVVLDEILVAVREGYISEKDVIDLIAKKPQHVELVLTGRGATPEIVKRADLVTEMLAIKHPFNKGIPERKGIEY